MNLTRLDIGSYVDAGDPGEPSTGVGRISVTDEEGEILAFLAAGHEVLEIGTGLGVSTNYLARAARSVVTIDIDPWVHETIWPTLPDNVTTLRSAVVLDPDARFDLVFIDGDHGSDAVRADYAVARAHCCDGIIAAHDFTAVRGNLEPGPWQVIHTTHTLGLKVVS